MPKRSPLDGSILDTKTSRTLDTKTADRRQVTVYLSAQTLHRLDQVRNDLRRDGLSAPRSDLIEGAVLAMLDNESTLAAVLKTQAGGAAG